MFDYLIVGAGISGCTLAERIATQLDKKVLIVDRRSHIGGLIYDYYNANGILVHQHGLHLFFTNSQSLFNYLSKFTEWHFYQPQVCAYVNNKFLPFPINRDTINQLYNLDLQTDEDVNLFLDKVRKPITNPCNLEEILLSKVGQDLYEKFFYNYTLKFWGRVPQKLDVHLVSRIPVRTNQQLNYSNYLYQGLPKCGYTAMLQKMINHDNISILLQTDYRTILDTIKFDRLIYTGALDEFFDYQYGILPYRSLQFIHETLDQEYYLPCQQVNYPNDDDFTRIYEFKYATGQRHHQTTIAREYAFDAVGDQEKYYPIALPENQAIFNKYKKATEKLRNITFCGRLTIYRYYSISDAVARALNLFSSLIAY